MDSSAETKLTPDEVTTRHIDNENAMVVNTLADFINECKIGEDEGRTLERVRQDRKDLVKAMMKAAAILDLHIIGFTQFP